jgi:formimidoylglutamate deiminase
MKNKKNIYAAAALTAEGWVEDSLITINDQGLVQAIESTKRLQDSEQNSSTSRTWLIPGFVNAHSHSFQYLMAGLAEQKPVNQGQDDFWGWRELMYQTALAFSAQELTDIAESAFRKMIQAGYTEVHEFHYLYNKEDGTAYDDDLTLPVAIINAAIAAGIRIKMCPVFYQQGGIDTPAEPHQRRFVLESVARYFDIIDQLIEKFKNHPLVSIGGGVHSIRAAKREDIIKVKQYCIQNSLPFYIHVSEQLAEVAASEKFYKKRPIEFLKDLKILDHDTWLIHATHADAGELAMIAKSKAMITLCPTTEANLGDGVFDFVKYKTHRGRWSIGSDSHVRIDPMAELRLLDDQHRLLCQKRMVVCHHGEQTAQALIEYVLSNGRCRDESGGIAVGKPLDAIAIDFSAFCGRKLPVDKRMPKLMSAHDPSVIQETFVQGKSIKTSSFNEGLVERIDKITEALFSR